MGTIAIKNNELTDWLARINESRSMLIQTAKSGDRIASAFATADARCDLIESLSNEVIRAKLLRITDPNIGMVELAQNPSEEQRIRFCAIAILSGFEPGKDEFGIWGGRSTMPYIKENGYRKLFGLIGITPDVNTGFPQVTTSDNCKRWTVTGEASCEFRGEVFRVVFDEKHPVGIEHKGAGDSAAGIAAKARRRMLQALWNKVSPILTDDGADADDVEPNTATVVENSKIETSLPSVQGVSKAEISFRDERDAVLKITSADPEWSANVLEAWDAFANAESVDELESLGEVMKDRKTLADNHKLRDKFRLFYNFRKEALS